MFIAITSALIFGLCLCDYVYSSYYDQPEIYDIAITHIPSVNLMGYNNPLLGDCNEYVLYITEKDYYYYYDNYDVIIYM